MRPLRGIAAPVRVTLTALTVLLLGATAVTWSVYVTPRRDSIPAGTTVDAVVGLGGWYESARDALRIGRQGAARTVVLSDPYDRRDPDAAWLHDTCRHPPAGLTVVCFEPEPGTTRGEAEEVRRLVRAHGWRSVAVVAPVFHLTRARLMMDRCQVPGLRMVPTRYEVPWWQWPYEFVYQTAGFAKAAVLRGC